MAIEQWLEQCLIETQILAVSEARKPDGHGLMTCRRLGPVGAAKIVPPGKREAEVCVGLDRHRRMMHAMHIGRDDEETEHTISDQGKTEVGVIKHGTDIQEHLEREHRQRRCPKGADGRALEQHGEENLPRMKPRTRGDVYIDVGVVHTMQAPEDRHRVKQHMLQVDGEIQQEDGDADRQEGWKRPDSIEEPPASLLRNDGHTDRRHRERRADDDSVEHYE